MFLFNGFVCVLACVQVARFECQIHITRGEVTRGEVTTGTKLHVASELAWWLTRLAMRLDCHEDTPVVPQRTMDTALQPPCKSS